MLKLEDKYKETFDKVEVKQNEKNKIYDSITKNKK